MEPPSTARSPCSNTQPHHHHHHHPLCHHRHHHRHHHHHHHHHRYRHHQSNCPLHISPRFALQPVQNPKSVLSYPLQKDLNLEATGSKETCAAVTQVFQEPECDVLELEEDDDPIFVLTDEWKEFFAKSEAKRKLERWQALIHTLLSYKQDLRQICPFSRKGRL